MVDETSGVMGLGFPRLSSFPNTIANATPFFVNLAQQGLLDYPLFGLSLTRNSTGSLSMGAVDSSVVKNASLISWNQVVDFAPFGAENNVSSYLQWAIPMSALAINGSQFKPSPTYPNITGNASLALFDIYGINTKEPPLLGLYPLYNAPGVSDTADSVASVFSSLSATIATTLPNYLLPTPTFTTPLYAFNTSVSHLSNGIATAGLATSTYRPILGAHKNVTALPKITPSPTLVTFIITGSGGLLITSTSTLAEPSVTLGVPPGWNAGVSIHTVSLTTILLATFASWIFIYLASIFSVV
ncbi:hypothetical protein DXG01_014905 [Tephrocybe rancida]|nr:hypothetical protein DXG01_014905 [Tephrocybe rancida]